MPSEPNSEVIFQSLSLRSDCFSASYAHPDDKVKDNVSEHDAQFEVSY